MVAGIGEDGDAVAMPGDVVRLIVKGGGYGAWIAAQKMLKRRPQVGDVVELAHDHAVLYSASGTPQTTFRTQSELADFRATGRPGTIGIYGPITLRASSAQEQARWLDAAIAAHYAAVKAPEPIPANSNWSNDDAPF